MEEVFVYRLADAAHQGGDQERQEEVGVSLYEGDELGVDGDSPDWY
jgi:hypothetical protein